MLSIVFVLAMAALPASPGASLESPTRHVRAATPYIESLVKEGFNRSPTFARLLARIEHSDLIVYVEGGTQMPAGIEGRLMMLPRAHDTRYVRIQIDTNNSLADTIALVGHELQHANELADAPDVTDQTGFVALYERIGISSGWHQYETLDAQETARQVRRELQHGH